LRRTFIDSGVLIAAATGKENLAESAFNVLNDPERVFVTSDFVGLEVFPKAEYHGNNNEVEFYEAFFNAVEHLVPISQELVSNARTEAKTFGLAALDALHVSAAKLAGSEEIVTTAKNTKPIFRVTGISVTTIQT
jgi:predicted nucleic acid-binding protein